jgi:membrane protein YdbS with pleckstrin-like domain
MVASSQKLYLSPIQMHHIGRENDKGAKRRIGIMQNAKGKYVRNALTKGENVIYEAKVSWARLAPLFLLAILTVMGILLIPLLIAMYRNIELALTNKRVIGKWGVLHRYMIEMNLNRVESVQIHQGLLGRMFNYGSLVVSGAGNPQAPIPGIKDPMTFRRILLETQEAIAGGSAYSTSNISADLPVTAPSTPAAR